MADKYRVTFAFSGKEHGWSETLVFDLANQTPGGVAALMNNLAQKRAEMLGREFAVTAFRVAKVQDAAGAPVKRAVFLSEVDFQPSDQTVNNAADAPDTCVVYNGFNGAGDKKKQGFLGGIPDKICTNGGDLDTNQVGWGTKFNSWASQVIALGGGWLQTVGIGPFRISGYVDTAAGVVTLTSDVGTWGAGPYTPKQQIIRVRGINGGKSVVNGEQEVFPKTDTTCELVKPLAALAYVSGGFLTKYTYPYPFATFALLTPVKIGNHKRGRPLFVSPGRARARART